MIKNFLILFLIFTPLAHAADYYVATTGSDSNPGSIGSPFLTMQKGVDTAILPGDTVLVNDGTYTAGFTKLKATGSGSAEAAKTITGITKASPPVITVSSHGYSNGDLIAIYGLNNFKINGMVSLNNRWFVIANVTTDTFELTGEDTSFDDAYDSGGTAQRVTPITIKAINRGGVLIDGSTIVTGWTGIGGNKYVSSPVGGRQSDNGADLWKIGRTTFLVKQLTLAAVVAENQFYYDPAADTYTLYSSTNPTLSVYKEPSSSRILVRGVSWILVDGFNIQYSAIPLMVGYSSGFPTPPGQELLGNTTNNLVQYISTSFSSTWGMAVQTSVGNPSSYNTFQHLQIQYADEKLGGANGHCFKQAANHNEDNGSYATVAYSTIHDCAYHGIQHSNAWSHGYYHHNRIYNTSIRKSGGGTDIRCGYSASAEPSNCNIFDNDLGNGANGLGNGISTGIFLQDTNVDSNIYRNKIHDHVWHAIYIFFAGIGPTAPRDAKIFNNLIYNNGSSGIKVDGSYSVKIYNNSFFNNGELVLYGAPGGAAIDLNNNFANRVTVQNNVIQTTNAASIYTRIFYTLFPSTNNLFYRTSGFKVVWNGVTYNTLQAYRDATVSVTSGGLDAGSVVGDPLYASPITGDLRIPSPATPADSIGINLNSIFNTDYTATTRQVPWDAGAYNTQGNLILFPSVVPVSQFPGATGNFTVSFTTSELSVGADDKIVIIFPADFILDNEGLTTAGSATNLDGTFTTSVVGQTVTVSRNNDGTSSLPNSFSFVLSNIKNPAVSGVTGPYSISLTDSSDTVKGVSNNVNGTVITDISPRTLSGLSIAGASV